MCLQSHKKWPQQGKTQTFKIVAISNGQFNFLEAKLANIQNGNGKIHRVFIDFE